MHGSITSTINYTLIVLIIWEMIINTGTSIIIIVIIAACASSRVLVMALLKFRARAG